MANGRPNRPPSQVSNAVVTTQGNNYGFDELEGASYQANREQNFQLTRDSKIGYLLCWIDAAVTVAGVGGAPTVVENGFLDVLERLRIRLLNENLFQHSARDLYELDRRLAVNALDYDDSDFDPTAAATYDLFAEFVVPFTLPFMASPFDFHARARRVEDEVREAFAQWSNAAENAGDDQGTGVLVTGGTQTLTWDREPELFVTAETFPSREDGGGDLPLAVPKVETFESEVFTTAQDSLKIDFTPDEPVLMVLLQGFDDGEPADLVRRVTVGDHPDYNRVPIEALRIRERRDFDAVETSVDHSIGILLASGGRWTNRFRPGMDLRKQRVIVDASQPDGSDPSGNGQIRVLAVTGLRQNVGRDVRTGLRPDFQTAG
jgi:hypothetical protein